MQLNSKSDFPLVEWIAENKKKISEFGPMKGSGNTRANEKENPVLNRLGALDKILMRTSNKEANREWDRIASDHLGEFSYWNEVESSHLERALDDAERIIFKYSLEDESTLSEGPNSYKPGTIAPVNLYYSDKHGKLVAKGDVDSKYHSTLELVYKKGDKIESPMDESEDEAPEGNEDLERAIQSLPPDEIIRQFEKILNGTVSPEELSSELLGGFNDQLFEAEDETYNYFTFKKVPNLGIREVTIEHEDITSALEEYLKNHFKYNGGGNEIAKEWYIENWNTEFNSSIESISDIIEAMLSNVGDLSPDNSNTIEIPLTPDGDFSVDVSLLVSNTMYH
jgi:hypothetical protein